MKNKNVWIVAIVVLAVFIAGFLWLFPEPAPDEASMSAPNEVIPVGKPTQAQLTKIAALKLPDLNTDDLEAAKRTIAGAARSMGVDIVD